MGENDLISFKQCESGEFEDENGKSNFSNASDYSEAETSNIKKLTFRNAEGLQMNGRRIGKCEKFSYESNAKGEKIIYKSNTSQSCNAVPSKEERNKYGSAFIKGEQILRTFYKSGLHLPTNNGKTEVENPSETWLTFHTGGPYQHNDLRAERSSKKKGTDKESKQQVKRGPLQVIKGDNEEIDAATNYAWNRNHAEFAMIQALKKMGVKDTTVYVHINYSPCWKCATDLKKIADDKNLHFDMKMASLYRVDRNSCIGQKCPCLENQKKNEKDLHQHNAESLFDLSENKRFTLTFFDKNHWQYFKSEICRYVAEKMSQPDSIDCEGKINSFIKCDLKWFLELRCEEDKQIIKDFEHLKNNRMASEDITTPVMTPVESFTSLENDGTTKYFNLDAHDKKNDVKEYYSKKGYRKDNLNHATPQQKDLQQKNSEKELTSSELTSTQADTDTTHDSSLQIAKPVFKYNVHAPDFIPKASAQDNNN